jgi:hypothetical protein
VGTAPGEVEPEQNPPPSAAPADPTALIDRISSLHQRVLPSAAVTDLIDRMNAPTRQLRAQLDIRGELGSVMPHFRDRDPLGSLGDWARQHRALKTASPIASFEGAIGELMRSLQKPSSISEMLAPLAKRSVVGEMLRSLQKPSSISEMLAPLEKRSVVGEMLRSLQKPSVTASIASLSSGRTLKSFLSHEHDLPSAAGALTRPSIYERVLSASRLAAEMARWTSASGLLRQMRVPDVSISASQFLRELSGGPASRLASITNLRQEKDLLRGVSFASPMTRDVLDHQTDLSSAARLLRAQQDLRDQRLLRDQTRALHGDVDEVEQFLRTIRGPAPAPQLPSPTTTRAPQTERAALEARTAELLAGLAEQVRYAEAAVAEQPPAHASPAHLQLEPATELQPLSDRELRDRLDRIEAMAEPAFLDFAHRQLEQRPNHLQQWVTAPPSLHDLLGFFYVLTSVGTSQGTAFVTLALFVRFVALLFGSRR